MNLFSDRPLVKICGMRSVEIAQAANDAGADLIGFVFAPSRRQVSAEQVERLSMGRMAQRSPSVCSSMIRSKT